MSKNMKGQHANLRQAVCQDQARSEVAYGFGLRQDVALICRSPHDCQDGPPRRSNIMWHRETNAAWAAPPRCDE